jgi:hypothetical protein
LAAAEQELAAFLAKYPQDSVARYHRTTGLDKAGRRMEGKEPVSPSP